MVERIKLNGDDVHYEKGMCGIYRGRTPGSTKKYTCILREAAIIAAGIVGDKIAKREQMEESGLIAFLIDAAEHERKAYLTFLAKMLPQVHMGADVHKKDNYITAEEFEEGLRERGLTLEVLKSILMSKVRRDGRPEVEADQAYLSGGY
jgi:hypothetical protein